LGHEAAKVTADYMDLIWIKRIRFFLYLAALLLLGFTGVYPDEGMGHTLLHPVILFINAQSSLFVWKNFFIQ